MLVRVWQNDQADLIDETILKPGILPVRPGFVHQFEGLEDGVAFELYWAEFSHDDIIRKTVGAVSEFYKNIHKKPSLIAGPCVWEGYSHAEAIAEKLLAVCGKHDVNFIYKTSFDKANRKFKGLSGAENAIEGFRELKKKFNLEILTDVHESHQPGELDVVDIFQIPAFLCRQTDLLAAAQTGKPVK